MTTWYCEVLSKNNVQHSQVLEQIVSDIQLLKSHVDSLAGPKLTDLADQVKRSITEVFHTLSTHCEFLQEGLTQ